VYSDTAGIARFPAIQWGDTAGTVELNVTAAKGDFRTGLAIKQQLGSHSVSVVPVPVAASPIVPQPVAPQPVAPEPIVPQPVAPAPTQVASVPKPAPPPEPKFDPLAASGAESIALADTIPQDLPAMNQSRSGISAPSGNPHPLKPNPPASTQEKPLGSEPRVSITNSPSGAGNPHASNKKLLVLLVVGVSTGAAAMLALKFHAGAGAAATSSSGISVGTPTISIGH
jgi:hypothetical protein